MSLFTRPSIVCAIIFGCFAVLIPRVFLPFFRPRPSHHRDDHFRRPLSPMSRNDPNDIIEPIPDSSPHMHAAQSNMRMHHPDVNIGQQLSTDQNSSKSAITFALPMYTVGIAVFFIYTCFKYWRNRNNQENKIKLRYSTNNIQWNAQNRKFKYHINNRHSEEDDENEEDSYAGLDADYVEYLKLKKQKELEAEQAMTAEQKQMHHTLDEMKNSLSFISSKLGANKTNKNLSNNEIAQLQDRLASTEAQMFKILNALDAASNKMNELTKNTRESLEQPQQVFIHKDEPHLSSRSPSESEGSINDEENSNSDDNSFHQEEQIVFNDKQQYQQQQQQEEQSSSSYEDDEEIPNEIEDDHNSDESESLSERYGIMNTNYGCDPTTIDDYELDTNEKPEQTSDSRTKVQEWHQRNHSQSLSSSNSSIEQDQSIPNEEQNHLIKRNHHE